MVSQGGEGGAYEEGGYTGQSSYSDGGVAAAIAGMGQTLGAALGSRTAADDNASDIRKKERLEGKSKDLKDRANKAVSCDTESRLNANAARKDKRIEKTNARIEAFNKAEKPTLKSDVVGKTTPVIVNAKINPVPTKEEVGKSWNEFLDPATAASKKMFGNTLQKKNTWVKG